MIDAIRLFALVAATALVSAALVGSRRYADQLRAHELQRDEVALLTASYVVLLVGYAARTADRLGDGGSPWYGLPTLVVGVGLGWLVCIRVYRRLRRLEHGRST